MSQELSKTQRVSIEWALLLTGVLCTLFVWTPAADPINLPKFVLLSLGASILAGLLLVDFAQSFRHFDRSKIPTLAVTLFLLVLFIATMASGNRYMSFFGGHGRNDGFLSSLALAILFIAAAAVFRINSATKVLAGLAVVGGVEAVYGFAQHFGGEPMNWNNPYNTVVGTLGNPDFMSAVLGITGVAFLWFAVDHERRLWIRIGSAAALAVSLSVIVFSQARQGLLAFVCGAVLLVIAWLSQRSRNLALGASVLTLVGVVAGIFGMLRVGPLSSFLYKPSITYRGDYWRAGYAIFKSHPLLGVGPDRFGAYFRQYRDATQVLRRGPDISSDVAHSVFIQIAATGGIFAVLLYLLLVGTIIWFGVRALRSASGRRQLVVAAVFGAWIAYQVQSAISIDNLGIAVWGWSLGGVVVGLAQPEFVERVAVKSRKRAKAVQQNGQQRAQLVGVSLASVFAIVSLILTGPMFGADVSMKTALGLRPATNSAADLNALKLAIIRAPNMRPNEPYYAVAVARLLFQFGLMPDGRALLQKDLKMDPRDYEAWYSLALSDEKTNKRPAAIPARQRIATLDPFNAPSLLELGRDLKAAGDLAGAKAIIAKINSFAPGSPEAKSAQTEFGS
jgi:O-antigen ligase